MNSYKTTMDTDEQAQAGVKRLNHLIEICIDGDQGFQDAADGLKDNPVLEAICLQYAKERGQFGRQLQNEVRQSNGEPASSGTLAGALHRRWMDIKTAVMAKDEEAIIAECEHGEDAAKEAYEEALRNYLPIETVALVQRQYKKILQAHDRFSALKKAVR